MGPLELTVDATHARKQVFDNLTELRQLFQRGSGYLGGLIELSLATAVPGSYTRLTGELAAHLADLVGLMRQHLAQADAAAHCADGKEIPDGDDQ